MREALGVLGSALMVLVGGVLLAVAVYFVAVIGAVLVGMLVVVWLARATARFIP